MTRDSLRTVTAGATDVGRKRSGNEDSYEIWVSDGLAHEHIADTLIVVCDGMGGSNAGEVASRMAAETVVRSFADYDGEDAVEGLTHAIESANAEVHEQSRTRTELNGMGTTCTAVALKGDVVFLAHVGDSRAYLVREKRIRQLTSDHSLVAQLVARHQISPEEARTDPRRNVVTRSVGVAPTVEVDAMRLEDHLQRGDTLLVCSDGLHGQVSDEDMARLASEDSLDRACVDLISLANQFGGPDNITVAMARLAPSGDAEPVAAAAGGADAGEPQRRSVGLLIAAAIALALALAGIAWVLIGIMRASSSESSARTSHEQTAEPVALR